MLSQRLQKEIEALRLRPQLPARTERVEAVVTALYQVYSDPQSPRHWVAEDMCVERLQHGVALSWPQTALRVHIYEPQIRWVLGETTPGHWGCVERDMESVALLNAHCAEWFDKVLSRM